MTRLRLHAPFAGWATALAAVPDPVFAEGMMGEGLAIDPVEGLLRAPCDGEVISVPDSRHAVTLRLANGAELLIHVGLETVGLGGAGFTAHVAAGQAVRCGDPLIGFDLDSVALRARSLVSPIVVTNEGFALRILALDRAVAAGEPIAEIAGGPAAAVATEDEGAETQAADVTIRLRHGIHARPAARIAAVAKGFAAAVELEAKGGQANARSPVALMALGVAQEDRVRVIARGKDAAAAVAALTDLIETGLEEAAEPPPAPSRTKAAPARPGLLRGVCAAPGLAIGPAARFASEAPPVAEQGEGVGVEAAKLAEARAAISARLARHAGGADSIAAAHLALLDDPELIAAADAEIAGGRSAGFAWRTATETMADRLRATGDPLLIERIDDLHDIERQVLSRLAGIVEAPPRDFPEGAILLADNLFPSQLMALEFDRIGGLCTAGGGPTSHAAIIAASAGVPMLAAVGEALRQVEEGCTLVLDAGGGWVDCTPDKAALEAARGREEARREQAAAELSAAAEDARTADGTRIEIFANLASADEAARAVAAGAEGCGLLRTEFLFHDRSAPPSEREQSEAYAEIARALGGRPLIVRTLDAGGDKPLPYLPMADEDNPALGLRGVRLSLMRPDLLDTQLRAILAAAPAGDIRVMAPMVVDVGELRAVRDALGRAAADLGTAPVPLGVMVETPAAALLAGSLAAESDFLSVGTNDLSQYALAADRGNPSTAPRVDALHPAVLRLIAAVAEGASGHGKWFGICGGIASDPLAAAILIGLGASELSATPASIPALKAAVRRLDMKTCRKLAARALEAETAEAVRALAAEGHSPEPQGAE